MPHRAGLAFELAFQPAGRVAAVGLRQCGVDPLPRDALALQGRADLVFAPAAQAELFADEGSGIAGVVDEAVAHEAREHALRVALRQPPAAHQAQGVAFGLLGPGAEARQRGIRLLRVWCAAAAVRRGRGFFFTSAGCISCGVCR